MANRTPKAAKAHADRLFSQWVRSVGFCENCGSTPNEVQLQCAHWISRRYSWTRTYELNAFCLCAACHRWFTDHPTEFGKWAIEQRGEDVYAHVLQRSNRRDKFDWFAEVDRLKGLLPRRVA